MQVHVEVELFVGDPNEDGPPQGELSQVKGGAPIGGGKSFRLQGSIGGWKRPQIEVPELHRRSGVVDDLDGLSLAHFKRSPPNLVAPIHFIERAFKRRNVEWFRGDGW